MEASSEPGTVSVHALQAGYFTLPERYFVSPLPDPNAKKYVPSLSFLIQHRSLPSQSNPEGQLTRIVFDLGLRRDISRYAPPIQKHTLSRQPMKTTPCVVESLAAGQLSPDDIDYIVVSHVHWDHVGMPSDFQKSQFIVGNGACGLLSGSLQLKNGSHSHFEPDLLPKDRTIELSSPEEPVTPPLSDDENINGLWSTPIKGAINLRRWQSMSIFPSAIDIFNDGSFYLVSAPGHLPGHLNALCRVCLEPARYVLLGADSCHDRRLLTGEKEIAEWTDPELPDTVCCIHADKEAAEQTLARIKKAESGEVEELGAVEVVFAHDAVWDAKAKEDSRFFPGHL